jgi:hypothetical protein
MTEPYVTLVKDTESGLLELTANFNALSNFLYWELNVSISVRNVTPNLKLKSCVHFHPLKLYPVMHEVHFPVYPKQFKHLPVHFKHIYPFPLAELAVDV